jgi:hypothetical protein
MSFGEEPFSSFMRAREGLKSQVSKHGHISGNPQSVNRLCCLQNILGAKGKAWLRDPQIIDGDAILYALWLRTSVEAG